MDLVVGESCPEPVRRSQMHYEMAIRLDSGYNEQIGWQTVYV